MEKFLSMVEGTASSEILNINQMDENLFKEFLQKELSFGLSQYEQG